ncbi:MAG TPA: acyltransferase [Polyangiaceae bacterium]
MADSSASRGVAVAEGGFHIPSLDGIRAISFLIVFLGHAGLEKVVPGYFGLSLFFFLSGYLITTLLRLEFERTGGVSLKQFYLRRILRIFPPFYLVLAVAMLLTALGLTGGTLWPAAVAAQCLHVTNYWIVEHGWWNGMAPGTWVYWSLAVEEHFYLLFPLLYLWLRRLEWPALRQAAFLAGICLLVLAWRFVLIDALGAHKERTYVASDTRVDSIIAGCILAIWKNPVLDRDSVNDRRLLALWLPLGTASVLASLVVREFRFDQTLRYTLQSFGLVPFFVAAIRFHDRWPFTWLNLAPVRYLGVLTYSMYLMHTTTLWMFDRHVPLPQAVRGVLAFALLVGLGSIVYYVVEKPCARLRRRLSRYLESDRRVRPQVVAAAAGQPSGPT